MNLLLENVDFKRDFASLKNISLNPERHTVADAHTHCIQVAKKMEILAKLNQLSDEQTSMMVMLAYSHDIGKTRGNAQPLASVELLLAYGVTNGLMLDYVKYHDINLPWYIAHCKGESPGDKAWRKLDSKVDMVLLCLFMIADRVDCPGGWQENEALMWFLKEADRRELLSKQLITSF
ncbi:hypothetical protein MNBD_GAMMA12-1075 [hydrothermal vent metagenome]|uniref:HD domain-containing protein n=1 Tax=hydrothermal vent metagenome TaxID=652676 RepID=A0A3B0YAF9_9ZZZZ